MLQGYEYTPTMKTYNQSKEKYLHLMYACIISSAGYAHPFPLVLACILQMFSCGSVLFLLNNGYHAEMGLKK